MRSQLKFLIATTISFSVLGLIFPILQPLLYFSPLAYKNLYIWQFFTHIFIEPGPFSFSFILNLVFNIYILWIFGSSLLERMHLFKFLSLYLGVALLTSLTSLFFPNPVLAGGSNAIIALLFTWMMLNPNTKLLLFFALPFQAHWLIIGIIGVTLALQLTHSDWIGAATLSISVLYAYFFSIIFFKEQSPFTFLRPFERWVLRLFEKKNKKPYQHTKIYDFKSGAPILNDEQFMDAMLEKISRLGECALTQQEKKRMIEISEKKQKP